MERLLTLIALLVLAVGFVSLGLLSLTNERPEDPATVLFSETTSAVIGSTISILVGAIFLAAALRVRLREGSLKPGRVSTDCEVPNWRGTR